MTLLDSHTTLILAALLFLLLPLLVAWVTRGHRHHDVIWWCAGSLCASLGLLLIAQREWLPTLVSYHAANTCLLTSLLLWSQSLRVFLGRPWTGTIVLVSVAAAAVFYGVIHAVLDMPTRSAATRLALAALSLQTAWFALQITRQSGSHNAAAISVSHLLLGLALGVQGLMFLENGTVATSPFSRTTDASIVALTALITAMIGHFCISGLVLERSTQRQVEALEARAAAEETVLLDAQLRKLDREDRLLLVSGSLAHELNQPLTAALTHAQVAGRRLQLDKADPAAIDDLLAKIAAGVQRASGILDRIRAAARASPVAASTFDLRSTVRASIELFETEWHKRGVLPEVRLGTQAVVVHGDELAVSQVLGNLLRNATDALEGRPDQRVEIVCEAIPAKARVWIRDRGGGVAQEILARWGEAFTGNRPQGLGLGLAISRAIVAQHKGELTLANHPEGGAIATLTLPLIDRMSPILDTAVSHLNAHEQAG